MNDALVTLIDGAPAQQLPANDRGLQYGDGLFETMLIRGGIPRFLEAHLARLALGCEKLAIHFSAWQELRAEISTVCAPAPALAMLKIIVTRGSALQRGYAPDGTEMPRRLLSLWKTSPLSEAQRAGADLVFASGRVADHPGLAGIKHLSRLENVLAAQEANAAGAFDALLRASDERLVSGAMSNLFVVRSGRVQTPSVDRAGVAGVLRGVVLRECAVLGIAISEQTLSLNDLHTADEAFVTNARIGVVPVRRVGEHLYRMNQTARRLASHIEALDA